MTTRSPLPASVVRVLGRNRLLAILLPVLLCGPVPVAGAQLISIKTVPVAEGDQFGIYPSEMLGMAGVSIALADTLLDPFVNPATGARVQGARLFGSPTFYTISSDAGGGRTLPLGGFLRSGSWFGAVSLAAQEIEASRRDAGFVLVELPGRALSERSRYNTYVLGVLGKALPDAGLSLGTSIRWSGLNMVDGVDLLYAGSQNIEQYGNAVDVRVGLVKEWEGDRTLEAVLVHNRYRMTHDVTYADWFWDPVQRRSVPQPRLEHNLDRTNTWGMHLQLERPLATPGWRAGALLTANRMSHPKIPNYEIMNIPRDPGHSYAFNFGVGFSRTDGPATFGIDLIYEPIWSNTWAEAEEPIATSGGGLIPAGGKTIENDFRFSNALVRMGVGREMDLGGSDKKAGLQLGLAVRSIHYWLEQYDNVLTFGRNQEERWIEWTPTWGLSLRFPELEIRYNGRRTNGTGRPGVAPTGVAPAAEAFASGRTLILAPSGPLTLEDVHVLTHQLSVSMPLR